MSNRVKLVVCGVLVIDSIFDSKLAQTGNQSPVFTDKQKNDAGILKVLS